MKKNRIEILDSFRFLAIVSVILYHYTYRWTIPPGDRNLYPYHNFYGNLFKYGNYGVHFFFIISGFVISYTLGNTNQFFSFWKNRFIRLFPPMLLWSVITYLVCIALDTDHLFPNSHQIKNFLPGLTFILPEIWTRILHIRFDWLNGSYWSLWVEVQFYFISSVLYYLNKDKFFRNILLLTVLLTVANYITLHFSGDNSGNHLAESSSFFPGWTAINGHLNISYFICYFTTGVIFHHLYKRVTIPLKSLTSVCAMYIFSYQLYAGGTLAAGVLYLSMIALFAIMIYRRNYLSFLDLPLFRRIGVISYSIYLAHENTGVLLINKYGGYLGKWSPLSVLLVLILIVILAELSYRFLEQKTAILLKMLLKTI